MRRFLTRTITTTTTTTQEPQLSELEKLRPSRLTKYLPVTNPLWYIDQIRATNKRLNRAFTKTQLLQLIKQTTATTNNHFNKNTPKQSLISFILFEHWSLTNPAQIPVDQSFKSLLRNFRSNQQTHPLTSQETFLLRLERTTTPSKNNLVDRLARAHNVTISLSLQQEQLTVFGQMKDRLKFWTDFERTRRTIHKQLVHLPPQKELSSITLNHLGELANCYLEQTEEHAQKNTLLAYAFDPNNLAKRVSDVVQRFRILSTEYDHTPLLIDIPETGNSPLGFLPFSYPFELEWPHHLAFDRKCFSRFASASGPSTTTTTTSSSIQSQGSRGPDLLDQIDLDHLLSSSLPILTRRSSYSDLISLQDWINQSFSISDSTPKSTIECKIYQGHYLKAKDSSSPLLDQSLLIPSPPPPPLGQHLDEHVGLIHHLRSFWTSNFIAPSRKTPQFIFLKSSRHPIKSRILSKKQQQQQQHQAIENETEEREREIEEERQTEVYVSLDPTKHQQQATDPERKEEDPQWMLTTYEVIRKRPNKDRLLDVDQDQENKEEVEVVDKVVKRRMVILRPHQSTDLMVEVEERIRLDVEPGHFRAEKILEPEERDTEQTSDQRTPSCSSHEEAYLLLRRSGSRLLSSPVHQDLHEDCVELPQENLVQSSPRLVSVIHSSVDTLVPRDRILGQLVSHHHHHIKFSPSS
ncbi:hypothetical protein PGT21_011532 [Puccinia graminis f. sp. tritici]|uniref:Integrase catalytic domain-containing protein n=1 Tax=Puccinia graminis f. sp. tritici TaxID=56615 RepID=A0A5B0QA73_PUCGR|nr:hypothetical protein PGT21_011532 [Puccinia graminis f. sp. tritici]